MIYIAPKSTNNSGHITAPEPVRDSRWSKVLAVNWCQSNAGWNWCNLHWLKVPLMERGPMDLMDLNVYVNLLFQFWGMNGAIIW